MTSIYKNLLFICIFIPSLSAVALEPLEPEAAQAKVMKEILGKLSTNHYQKRTFDDEFSKDLHGAYLKLLDGAKVYFLESDIAALDKWRLLLDEELSEGNLEYGYEAFNLYREIAVAQTDKNIALLESDFEFNFEDDEYLLMDLDQRSWPKTAEERDEWWRKRMEFELLRLVLNGNELPKARELLAKRYKTDRSRIIEMTPDDVFNSYAGTATTLFDPHTNYFSPRNAENFNINMSLSLEGIGAVLQRVDEYIQVVRVVPGGPADLQGELKAGDKIIGIADNKTGENVDLIGWRTDDAVELIRGPKNTTAVLQVLPAAATSSDVTAVIEIVRDEVKLEEQAAKKEVVEVPFGDESYRIGVINIPTFYLDFEAYRNRDPNYKSTSKDVRRLMYELLTKDKVRGIILDLRGNGGGSLVEATALSDLFIDPGPVVQIRNSSGRVDRSQVARNRALYKGPLIVLIDRLSASASEIFAGAIQDYGRGIIVGSQSFGKGTVQTLLPLQANQGQLKMTEAKFYRISGDSTQNHGISPDIEFPSGHNLEEFGESNQPNALSWDSIPPARHRKQNELSGDITVLEQWHKERIASDPFFTLLEERLELGEQYRQQDRQQISLNEKNRKQDRLQREQQDLELENKLRITRNLQPYPDYASLKAAREAVDVESLPLAERDPRLMEASRILVDIIQMDKDPSYRYAHKNGNSNGKGQAVRQP